MTITETLINQKLQMWLDAEDFIAQGKSYKIGTRELTRENLSEIRDAQLYWETRLCRIKGGGPRVMRVTPRDL
ncbi:MAG: DUF6148 family protein [Bacillota bacterium]